MRRIMIAASLLALVMIVGWYEGFYRPEGSHISALKAKQQTAQSAVLSLDSRYASLVSSEKQLPMERAALKKLMTLLPAGPDLDSLEKVLAAAVTASGAKLVGVSSPAPNGFGSQNAVPAVPGSGPSQLSLALGVTGTQHQLLNLYRVLNSDSRLFVIDNCVIGLGAVSKRPVPGSSGQTEATINIRAFFSSASPTSAAS